MSELIKHATKNDFKTEVLESETPVLVDFWAEWCGPCKAMSPVVDELAEKYQEKLKVVKVDVEAEPELATEYKVRGIPTLMVFKGGEAVKTKAGMQDKYALQDFVDSAL